MKIAITGANGFVGQALINHFSALGHDVLALIRPSAILEPGKYRIYPVDYSDSSSLCRLFADIDILIHNAGQTKALHHLDMLAANSGLTRRLVQIINTIPRPIHFVYLSSQAASRQSIGLQPVREDEASEALSMYGKSKALAERIIRRDARQLYTIVRPCPVYGPKDRDFLALFRLAKKGLNLQIGRREHYVNMIYVKQLAEFISLVINNEKAFGETFFATDGQVYTQAELAQHIARAMGKRSLRINLPEPFVRAVFHISDAIGRIRGKALVLNKEKMAEIFAEAWLADTSKGKEILGWEPEARLPEYIMETYQWYKDAGWL